MATSRKKQGAAIGGAILLALIVACSEGKAPSTIKASLSEFRSGMPLFDVDGLDRQEVPEGTEYTWKAKAGSPVKQKSWVRFEDRGSDGSVDQITTYLLWDVNQRASQMGAFAIMFRLVQIASAGAVDSAGFTAWLSVCADRSAKGEASTTKTFGSTPVKFVALKTGDGLGIMLTIG